MHSGTVHVSSTSPAQLDSMKRHSSQYNDMAQAEGGVLNIVGPQGSNNRLFVLPVQHHKKTKHLLKAAAHKLTPLKLSREPFDDFLQGSGVQWQAC